ETAAESNAALELRRIQAARIDEGYGIVTGVHMVVDRHGIPGQEATDSAVRVASPHVVQAARIGFGASSEAESEVRRCRRDSDRFAEWLVPVPEDRKVAGIVPPDDPGIAREVGLVEAHVRIVVLEEQAVAQVNVPAEVG